MRVQSPNIPSVTVTPSPPSSSGSSAVLSTADLGECDSGSDTHRPRVVEFSSDGEPIGAVPGWGAQLLKSARFAHSDEYINILASHHGFAVVATKITILRTEETVPLQGRFYLLQLL
jgi:hypothetical protein